jgi:hypothetical protein
MFFSIQAAPAYAGLDCWDVRGQRRAVAIGRRERRTAAGLPVTKPGEDSAQ